MFGFTQKGQQCPGYSVAKKPTGHFRSPHSPHAPFTLESVCTSIFVFLSLSNATTNFPFFRLSDFLRKIRPSEAARRQRKRPRAKNRAIILRLCVPANSRIDGTD